MGDSFTYHAPRTIAVKIFGAELSLNSGAGVEVGIALTQRIASRDWSSGWTRTCL